MISRRTGYHGEDGLYVQGTRRPILQGSPVLSIDPQRTARLKCEEAEDLRKYRLSLRYDEAAHRSHLRLQQLQDQGIDPDEDEFVRYFHKEQRDRAAQRHLDEDARATTRRIEEELKRTTEPVQRSWAAAESVHRSPLTVIYHPALDVKSVVPTQSVPAWISRGWQPLAPNVIRPPLRR